MTNPARQGGVKPLRQLVSWKHPHRWFAAIVILVVPYLWSDFLLQQQQLMGCKAKHFRPAAAWDVFDMEAVFAGRRNVTFDEVLEEYADFHLRTSANILDGSLAAPILLYSNNKNGMGNRQLAYADVLTYSMIVGRVFFHEWTDPVSYKVFYSTRGHRVLETVDYELSRHLVDSMWDRQDVTVAWQDGSLEGRRRAKAAAMAKLETDGVPFVHLRGWASRALYAAALDTLLAAPSQSGGGVGVGGGGSGSGFAGPQDVARRNVGDHLGVPDCRIPFTPWGCAADTCLERCPV